VKDRATARRVALIVVALACVLAAGCAGMKHAQPQEPVAPAAQVAPPVVVEQPVVAAPQATPAVPAAVDASVPSAAPAPPALAPPTQVKPASPAAPVAAPRPEVATTSSTTPPRPAAPVKLPTAPAKPPPAVATLPAAKPPAAPVASKPAAPPLDLKSLEARLRDTKAIGVFTKLSLKNQVDDLLEKFRAYHKRQSATPLAELRQSYNMLLLKVLSLLQDGDPSLARDVVASREALWGILSDPRKFTESNLMAGVTQ